MGYEINAMSLPSGWTVSRLSECTVDGNISYGIVQPGSHDPKGVPMLRVNNVRNGILDLRDVLRVSPEIEKNYARTRLVGGEVILTLVGSTGQSVVIPKQLAGWNVARAIAVIKPKEGLSPDWINLCLQSRVAQRFLDVRANTTVQKTLNLGDVKKTPIVFPPNEQRIGIEKFAVSLSTKIELNRRMNRTLETMAQATFKSWFVDFEPVKAKVAAKTAGRDPERAAMAALSGKLRIPKDPVEMSAEALDEAEADLDQLSEEQCLHLAQTAALFPYSFEESELGLIPSGWEVAKANEILVRLKAKKRYSKKDVSETGTIPVFEQGANLLLGFHESAPEFRATPQNPLLIFGDHTCIMHLSCRPFSISQNVIPLKGFQHPTMWVYFALKDKQQFQEYRRHWSELIIKEVVVPKAELSSAFSELVKVFLVMREATSHESRLLAALRDTLLPKLLSGELPVSASK